MKISILALLISSTAFAANPAPNPSPTATAEMPKLVGQLVFDSWPALLSQNDKQIGPAECTQVSDGRFLCCYHGTKLINTDNAIGVCAKWVIKPLVLASPSPVAAK
jgi:hypothetical protein